MAATNTLPTTFTTPAGVFPYSTLTPAMRRVILSASDSGLVKGSTVTVDRLVALDLVQRRGFGYYLTHSGEGVYPYV